MRIEEKEKLRPYSAKGQLRGEREESECEEEKRERERANKEIFFPFGLDFSRIGWMDGWRGNLEGNQDGELGRKEGRTDGRVADQEGAETEQRRA